MSKYQEIQDYIKWYQEKYAYKDGTKPIPIFEIMVFEYPNKELIYHKREGEIHSGYPDTGCIDHMGFYYELDTAIKAMNEIGLIFKKQFTMRVLFFVDFLDYIIVL